MNVLLLTTGYPTADEGYGGTFVHSLARALARRGHRLRVVVPARDHSMGRARVDGLPVWQFRYALRRGAHRLTSIDGGIPEALKRSRLAAAQVPALLAAFAAAALRHARWADVIHANWLGAGVAGALAHVVSRTPVVLTLRGDDAYNIHAGGLWRLTGRCVFSQCAAVTAVSENMPPLVQPFLPARCGPVTVPTFGVDTGRFRPAGAAERAARGGAVAGVFVGNILRAKGVDVLLEALAACRGDWRSFRFVGDGPDMDRMRALADALGLGGAVEWAGRRPTREVPALLRSADFLVLPSLSEGRPNVVLEALASGLAVVATRVGGVPHLVADGRTGLLVDAGDADQLAAAIARLCRQPDLRAALGRAGRQYIEDNKITWDRTAEELEAVFRRVARRG